MSDTSARVPALLSVVAPVYNEEELVEAFVERACAARSRALSSRRAALGDRAGARLHSARRQQLVRPAFNPNSHLRPWSCCSCPRYGAGDDE